MDATIDAAALDVARHMGERLQGAGYVQQWRAAKDIAERFGAALVSPTPAGGLSIRADVLAAFKALTPEAKWDRRAKGWRRAATVADLACALTCLRFLAPVGA